ncbi:MAG: TonB-dependent receptor [Deltaproteobacteria bacterium]|jgi:hemoglobin/transferrin/lactoferrin receptor protein|nr:TonB-dependent receptor [Deltaproteobacteria bacterium]
MSFKIKKRLGFFVAICFFWALAFGRAGAEEPVVSIEPIIVSASRTESDLLTVPMSVSVVDKIRIEEHFTGANTAEKLLEVPGVSLYTQGRFKPGNNSMVNIRGQNPWRVLYLIDGIRQSSPFKEDTNKGLLNVDPLDIERIEVIKGPASSLYGSDAIGGVINVITKKGGEGKPVGGRVGLTYDGSNQGFQPSMAIYGDTEKFNYRLSGSYQSAGNRRSAKAGRLDHSSFKTESFLGQFGIKFDNGTLDFKFTHYDSDVQEPPFNFENKKFKYYKKNSPPITELSVFPKNQRDSFQSKLTVNTLSNYLEEFSILVYYQEIDTVQQGNYQNVVNHYNGEFRSMLEDIVNTYGATIQTNWSFGSHKVILGFEYLYDDLHSHTVSPTSNYFIDADQTTKAVYIQDSWNIYGPLTLIGGLRQTWIELGLNRFTLIPDRETKLKFDNLVGNLGLTFAVTDNFVLRGQYSQGFRTPDLASKLTGTSYIVPRTDLGPEESENYEIGARYYDGDLFADVTFFHDKVENYISANYLYSAQGHWFWDYVNTSEYESYGLELAVSYRIGDTGFTPYGNITSLHTKFKEKVTQTETKNNGTPRAWGAIGLKWEKDFGDSGRFFSDAALRISGGSKLSSSRLGVWHVKEAGRTLDLTLGFQYGQESQVKAMLSVKNIFDKEFEASYFYYPGRHVLLTVLYSF